MRPRIALTTTRGTVDHNSVELVNRTFVDAGCDGVVVYQETYDARVYPEHHLKGNKRFFSWRLGAPERAARAGARRLGVGTLIGLNGDWQTGGQKQEIIDSMVPPKDDRESAIVATLNPGAYTAIVRGKNNTTGVALVELYVLQ